ncbi:MAG: ABC transporter permease [Flavobacteriales bacterium]|nr:ABC transporter permease [Flavobacteriales bacterium]
MYFKLAWRNIWRNKRRSLITIGSILFAVFFALLMRSFQEGMYEMMIDSMVSVTTGHLQVHKEGYWDDRSIDNTLQIDDKILQKLNSIDNVSRTCPRIDSYAWLSSEQLGRGALIIGLNPEVDVMELSDKLVNGKVIGIEDRSIMIGEGMAEYFGLGVGDSLVMMGQGFHAQTAAAIYPVSGILHFGNPKFSDNLVVMPLKLAQEFLSTENRVSSILIELDDITTYAEAKPKLATLAYQESVDVLDYTEMIPEVLQAIQADRIGGKMFIGILYIIISFGIFGTIMMMTAERRYEYGVLVAIGMNRFKLFMITLRESVLIALVGVVMGFILVFPLLYRMNTDPMPFAQDQMDAFRSFGIEPAYYAVIDLQLCFEHMLIIFCIAMVVNIYPLIKIMTLRPVEAMRI